MFNKDEFNLVSLIQRGHQSRVKLPGIQINDMAIDKSPVKDRALGWLSYKPILRTLFWSLLRINYKRQLPGQLLFLNQTKYVHLERPLPPMFIFKCPCFLNRRITMN